MKSMTIFNGPYICPICKKWSCSLVLDCYTCNAYNEDYHLSGDSYCTKFGTGEVEVVECGCDKQEISNAFTELLTQEKVKGLEGQVYDLHIRLKDINNAATELLNEPAEWPINTGLIDYIRKRSKT